MDLMETLMEKMLDEKVQQAEILPINEHIELLRSELNKIESTKFEKGDIVRITKEGEYRYPRKGEVALVVEGTTSGFASKSIPGAPTYCWSMKILCRIPHNGDLEVYTVESRYFEKVPM